MAEVRAERDDGLGGPEAPAQETDDVARSGGTATECWADPQSMPAALGLMRSSTARERHALDERRP
ncbi:MAG: hypothetical protein ABR543_17835 [Gemmatimonadaceae bacterium]